MKKSLFVLAFILPCLIHAQPYVDGGKTRHRFAQMSLGIDQRAFLGIGTYAVLNDQLQVQNRNLNPLYETRLIIGGTHFWGHADFFIAIPVLSLSESGFRSGVETGGRYYPLRLENKKLRPFIGASWLPISYKQEKGTQLVQSKFPLSTGVSYQNKQHLFEFTFGYMHQNTLNYYISPQVKSEIKLLPYFTGISYKYLMDLTIAAEKDWQSGRTEKLTDTLSKLNRLNGLTLAIGPSSAFFMAHSPHLESKAIYASQHKSARIFPEFGIGYYLHRPDLQFNLAYRNIKSGIEAYDFAQVTQRRALTFETYKFLFDYHGFVPFLGVSIGYEWLTVRERLNGVVENGTSQGVKPGLTFGWDIRPNRLQAWYLRTNLRYVPNLKVNMPSEKHMLLDQLEFNFIQLVVFPGRIF